MTAPMTARFDPRRAALDLAATPPAASEDFLPRAAACHAMQATASAAFVGFNPLAVWPGRLSDFRHNLGPADHLALAEALITLARAPERKAAA